ncbi:hypothetical protein PMIN06_013155 [Paraphaeosphaeria minitans]
MSLYPYFGAFRSAIEARMSGHQKRIVRRSTRYVIPGHVRGVGKWRPCTTKDWGFCRGEAYHETSVLARTKELFSTTTGGESAKSNAVAMALRLDMLAQRRGQLNATRVVVPDVGLDPYNWAHMHSRCLEPDSHPDAVAVTGRCPKTAATTTLPTT